MATDDDAAALLRHRCNVYVAQVAAMENSKASRADWLRGSITRNATVGFAYWIERSLADHPWRVHSPDAADIVYVNASFSYTAKPELSTFHSALQEVHLCRRAGHSASHCAALGLRQSEGGDDACQPQRFASGDCHQVECAARQRLAARRMPRTAEVRPRCMCRAILSL